MSRVSEDHEYIISRASELSDDEAAFVRRVVDRVLITGRRNYSPWQAANETRDMRHEAQEEMLDGCVYLAMHSVMRERARKERVRCFKADEDFKRTNTALTEFTASAEDGACTDCLGVGDKHRIGCPWMVLR